MYDMYWYGDMLPELNRIREDERAQEARQRFHYFQNSAPVRTPERAKLERVK